MKYVILAAHLCETDSSRLFTEALTAKVKTILANETSLVSTQAANRYQTKEICAEYLVCSPLSATLSVFAGAREPNGVVGHFGFRRCLIVDNEWLFSHEWVVLTVAENLESTVPSPTLDDHSSVDLRNLYRTRLKFNLRSRTARPPVSQTGMKGIA